MKKALVLIFAALLLAISAAGVGHVQGVFAGIEKLREAGDYGAALTVLEKFKKSLAGYCTYIPQVSEALDYEEAVLRGQQGEFRKAKELFTQLAQSKNPRMKADAHYSLGKLALILDGNPEEAIAHYQAALALGDHIHAKIDHELLLQELEKERKAREGLEKDGTDQDGKNREGNQEGDRNKEADQRGPGNRRSLLQSKELWGGSPPPPERPQNPRY